MVEHSIVVISTFPPTNNFDTRTNFFLFRDLKTPSYREVANYDFEDGYSNDRTIKFQKQYKGGRINCVWSEPELAHITPTKYLSRYKPHCFLCIHWSNFYTSYFPPTRQNPSRQSKESHKNSSSVPSTPTRSRRTLYNDEDDEYENNQEVESIDEVECDEEVEIYDDSSNREDEDYESDGDEEEEEEEEGHEEDEEHAPQTRKSRKSRGAFRPHSLLVLIALIDFSFH